MPEAFAAFSNSYARLPEHFFARLAPTPVAAPRLLLINRPLAGELGIDLEQWDAERLAQVLAGNLVPTGADPISMAYAGHQFGGFVPQLGDGRAILLGEVIDNAGTRRDIQLKGSGRTPFSRRGDGRAALGPVLREYLVSEAMHALGIPATRALAAVATGEKVLREDGLLPGAVLTRVAAGHVRVGTFEYFAARGDDAALGALVRYVIERHYPAAGAADNAALALLQAVARRQASLVAHWMAVGFVHGVMNTDNMAVSGETIDFGPCAFLEQYDPAAVFSAIDDHGRYAFANQARVAHWNLARLAEAILRQIDPDVERAVELAGQVLADFPTAFEHHWLELYRRKIGLLAPREGDRELIDALLEAMRRGRADFTQTFRALADAVDPAGVPGPRRFFAEPAEFDRWELQWRQRLAQEPLPAAQRALSMRAANPAYIPRNHRVEQALEAAIERGDLAPTRELLEVLAHPYEDQEGRERYATPASAAERVSRTFCGT